MKSLKNLSSVIIFSLLLTFSQVAFGHNHESDSIVSSNESSIVVEQNETPVKVEEVHHHNDHAHAEHTAHQEHGGGHAEHEGEHHTDTSALFFVIIAVFIGAATRHFLKSLPFPFTVLLLIIGLILGVFTRLGYFHHWGSIDVSFIEESFEWAANIDPHLLFFIFLPILIFEAAFAMDLHTFKKSAANSTILAVPGIIIALVLTGALVYAIDYFNIGLEGWGHWGLAFMFGSVISATDPVAVVALLKDLGASKKLGTLIEGESLLNDGTAIVLFMVFFLGMTGEASDNNGLLEFFRVAFGGIAVGAAIGWVVLKWIKKVFNDAMVEISVVVAAAYISFYIAEHFFHVSGVLALVALGLLIGGVGRSSISPQVEHFMHEFWELAGFIANCIIFLIVGFVIAERTEFTANDFLVLGIVYVGIHVSRAIMLVILYPFMKKTGYGLPIKDAVVVWFGALRGAIALALALIVLGVSDQKVAEYVGVSLENAANIKNQFLFLIAGTVTLTLLVNATTIKLLVMKLGLLKVAPAKELMVYTANENLKESVEEHINELNSDRYLKKADWDIVKQYVPATPTIAEEVKNAKIETIAETRRRLLEKEKASYWYQFKEGLLGAEAVQGLSDGINELLDAGGNKALSDRDDLEESWEAPKWMQKIAKMPVIGNWGEKLLLDRLAKSYDSAVGFITAQDEAAKLLSGISKNQEVPENEIAMIEEEINENRIHGQAFIRNLRKNYPDIYNAISTRQAIRNLLNYEKSSIDKLLKSGRIDSGEADKMHSSLKERIKRLIDNPPAIIHTEGKKSKHEDAE
jgi:NhaP-type Na+/H+ or K+/H+ antiporter